MLISAANEQQYATDFAKIPQAIRETILRATVKLVGSAGGTFTGSGVIIYADGETTTIVSAKHNLWVLADKSDPPEWDDAYVRGFKANVSIKYGPTLAYDGAPDQTAAIAGITPVVQDGGEPSWLYDVMLITSTDVQLAAHAAKYHIGPTGQMANLTFLTTPKQYLKRAPNQTYFVRTGFGKVRENPDNKPSVTMPIEKPGTNREGRLQLIMTEPSADKPVTVYSQQSDHSGYYQFNDAVQVTADPNSSTAPGDSGGPLFYVAVGKTPNVWLIGVTTGADMDTAQKPCPPAGGAYRVNNIVTSLSYCYQNLDLAY